MADNALTKLPLAGQIGISVALAVLIGGGFYYLKYSDMVVEEEKKTTQLETLQKDIRALEVTAARLAEFQREVQLLEAKLDTLKRILPPVKETPDLIRKVQALAATSNLAIQTFNPGAVAKKEFYEEWPINISVIGNYHNLALFFDRVSRLSRLVNIGSIKITASAQQTISKTIAVSCVATTYVYIDPPPPAPGQPKK